MRRSTQHTPPLIDAHTDAATGNKSRCLVKSIRDWGGIAPLSNFCCGILMQRMRHSHKQLARSVALKEQFIIFMQFIAFEFGFELDFGAVAGVCVIYLSLIWEDKTQLASLFTAAVASVFFSSLLLFQLHLDLETYFFVRFNIWMFFFPSMNIFPFPLLVQVSAKVSSHNVGLLCEVGLMDGFLPHVNICCRYCIEIIVSRV